MKNNAILIKIVYDFDIGYETFLLIYVNSYRAIYFLEKK